MHKRVLTARSSHEDWLRVYNNIDLYVSFAHIKKLIMQTLDDMHKKCKGRKAVYAWSGGKDSLPLGYLTQLMGIRDGVLAVTHLDWPELKEWFKDYTPEGLETINTGQDLEWLAANPELCFPKSKKVQYTWAIIVQQRAQKIYYRKYNPDLMMFGRRSQDGNHIGPRGDNIYTTNSGETHYNPIAAWSNEEVLGCIRYYNLSLPPCYFYPKGFKTGAGAWPKMVSIGSDHDNWKVIWNSDKRVVLEAADYFDGAKKFVEKHQKKENGAAV